MLTSLDNYLLIIKNIYRITNGATVIISATHGEYTISYLSEMS